MSRTDFGFPSELVALLGSLNLQNYGNPLWKLAKQRKGYSLKVFWKTETVQATSLNNDHQLGRPTPSRRQLRSKKRLEAFLERKESEKLERSSSIPQETSSTTPLSTVPHSDHMTPLMCEQPKVDTDGRNLSALDMPSANIPEVEKPAEQDRQCNTLPLGPTSEASQNYGDELDKTNKVHTDEPIVNLAECEMVEYEMRDRVPGVRYKCTVSQEEGWTPVKKARRSQGSNQREDQQLKLGYARGVKVRQENGQTYLHYRYGNTRQSYTCVEVVPASPIANRTRKTRKKAKMQT